ncbi:MAG: hypothetical protein P4M11_13350 [Candidatus Pacebacteria bacterium]|nr:hypothetical protein [Candidatus Paceibacterota bacterium]
MSPELCREIADTRRKLRALPDGHVLFLDETAMRVNEAPTSTIVLPGEQQFVLAENTTSYATRYDMIACCTSKETLPPIIYAPNERRKGIDTEMLLAYIRDFLAQSAGALDRYPLTLVVDQSPIHNTERMLEAFHDWGCQELTEIVLMPSMSAKRLSPLDNALFHDWKERVRKHAPITSENIRRLMSDEWNNLPASLLAAHYRHCLLRPRQPLLSDCPAPNVHQHR